MNILIIGSGGREHALAWKCAQSALAAHIYVAPGNAGTATEPGVSNVAISATDTDQLINFAQSKQIGLTIVGPEVPLVDGMADQFNAAGLKVFGPSAAAARLEGSKGFSKDFMARHKIPTAKFQTFDDESKAADYLQTHPLPVVIKADGLAAGKGVVIATTLEQSLATITDMLSGNAFGEAGHRVVIEEFMQGEEASFICLVHGRDVTPLATSQDHKARDEGDTGPNTGGMGAYSPAPVVTDAVHQHIMDTIIKPTVNALADDGSPYTGFLYAGLMINEGQAKVVEFNVRLGDPETQPLLMRLESDLVETLLKTLDGKLNSVSLEWKSGSCVGVVMAAKGYPGSYSSGDVINGLQQADSTVDANGNPGNCKVFHAGTTFRDNDKPGDADQDILTNGGRVLCVVAQAITIQQARDLSYDACQKITWDNMYYRKDIAHRAM